MKYLITGGAGFIGSHLAERLLDQGHSVTVIDDLSTGRKFNVSPLPLEEKYKQFEFLRDHICEATNNLYSLFDWADVVFHLAASVGVKRILSRPVESIKNNLEATSVILKLASELQKKVVFTSTSEVYGKSAAAPFLEDDDIVLGRSSSPRWSYAASKLVDEHLCFAYHKEMELPIIIVRLFNVVGARQSAEYGMVLPRFVEQAKECKGLTIYGDGSQSRCFLHVLDAVEALIALSNCEEANGEVVNVGSIKEITISDLAYQVIRQVNPRAFPIFVSYEAVYPGKGFEDMRRRVPNVDKLKALTGWAPNYTLEEAITDVKIGCCDTAL